jgi:hypothetical protein
MNIREITPHIIAKADEYSNQQAIGDLLFACVIVFIAAIGILSFFSHRKTNS